MRYDSYESKVVKIAKFFKLLFKHRVKIIISLAVVLTTTVTLLATRGIIVNAKECPDEIFYGEKLDYSAGAFISKTQNEYSSDGDSWTTEHPIVPGNYYVRAAAKATFGMRYGEPQPFKILPKPIEITVADTSVEYGNTPKLVATLAYNDKINCDALIYSNTDALGMREVTPDLSSLKIENKKGDDVTHCYVITAKSANVTVVPRKVILTVLDETKEYDTKPLLPTRYAFSEGALATGDTASVTLSGSQTDAGTSNSWATYVFFDKNGNDVSAFYNVSLKPGTLSVKPREITLSSKSSVKFYDATPLSLEGYTLTGTLADGHTLALSDWKSITDKGEIKNSFTVTIKDSVGTPAEEILKNYKINCDFGTLKVEARPIIITTGSHAIRYDGEDHVYGEGDILSFAVEGNENSGLAADHRIVVTANALFKNVADSGKNDIQFEIYSGSAPISKDNYSIDLRLGDVTVEPRPVVVSTGSHVFTYDDSYHLFDDVFASSVPGDENSGLANTDTIAATEASVFKNVADSGTNDVKFEFFSGGTLVDKNNYAIIPALGTVAVEPIRLVLQSPDYTLAYDGREHNGVDGALDIVIKEGYLVPGHYFEITEKTTVKNVVTGVENYFNVEIIGNDQTPATNNYDIKRDFGKITVTPPTLIINMKTDTLLYNGKEISIGYDSLEGLAYGHSLVINAMTTEKNAGAYVNTVTDYDIVDENGQTVKPNYMNVIINDGVLTITQRKVMLIPGSAEKMYDGTPLTAEFWICAEGNPDGSYHALAEGHTVKATYSSITNAGTQANEFIGDIYILDENNVDVSYNYIIERGTGTLTVTKRNVTFVTLSDSFVYDGKDHIYGTSPSHAWVKPGDPNGLCLDHYLVIRSTKTFRNVPYNVYEQRNELEVIVVDDFINQNYNLIPEYGYVIVTPRPITITTGSHEFVYDGYAHEFGEGDIFAEAYNPAGSGLCEGHSLHLAANSVFKEVKNSGPNAIGYEIREGTTLIDKHNYAIREDFGTVTVIKRPMVVKTTGDSFRYDGKVHEYGEEYISYEAYNPEGRGLCQMHVFSISGTSKFTNVADSGPNAVPFEILENSMPIDKDNYEIIERYESVTVTKRPITITTVSDTFTYDGKTHEYGEDSITAEAYDAYNNRGLCEGHSLYVVAPSRFKEVKDTDRNDIPYQIKAGTFVIDKNNYEINENFGFVRINKRAITITTPSDSFIYDGKTHEYGQNEIYAEPYSGAPLQRGLCETHSIYVVESAKFKNVKDSGQNVIKYQFRDGSEVIDSDNYNINERFGTVTVTHRPITLTSESYVGPYLGEKLNLNGITVSETEGLGLCEGHSILAEDKFYFELVDNVENDVAFDILDENKATAKENYEITYIKGRVTIHKRNVIIKTDSGRWIYDGLDHSAPNFKFTGEGDLILEGHRLTVLEGTVIREVGQIENTLTLKVIDAKTLEDVSRYYDVTQIKGILEVYFDINIVTPPPFPGNPGIGLPEDQNGEGEPSLVFIITSDSTGRIYLKQGSFGNYTGKGWTAATPYSELILDYASAYYLNSMAAAGVDLPFSSLLIDSKQGIYVLPYYSLAKGHVQVSDTVISGDASKPYSVYYYPSLDGAVTNPSLIDYEAAYRSFVYNQYLTVDDETRAYMNSIIANEGFTKYDIDAVASYIMKAAKYDLKYDRSLDGEENIVVAFLDEYKTGICQHYASAATMLYRTLGIPARYTIGYVADAKAGIDTEVTSDNAHAWVEIYLDGIGWVQVEVTGGDDGGGAPGVDEEEPYLAYSPITVRPASQAKEYDSYPLYAKNELDMSDEILRQLLAYGYKVEFKASGSQTEIGVGTSYVDSFVIYNHKGEDITYYYDVKYDTGTLHVTYSIVEIYLHEKVFEYSGSTYSFTNDEYFVTKISEELTLVVDSINISLTSAGFITSEHINRSPTSYISYRVLTKGGVDVTDKCTLRVASYPNGGQYDVMTINKRQITITTGSATREYIKDTPLTNKTSYMSHGQLGAGHELYVEVTGEQTEVGTSKNAVNSSATKITDSDGHDCTKNYLITWELGQLTVTN